MANRKIAHGVRVALLTTSAACAGLYGASAAAQDVIEEIVVTGSRIRVTDLDTPRPVVMITREDIENQGFQNIADILQNLSATGSPPLSRASPLSAGEAAGGTFIDLRGLGATRTLVLMDGKRLGITTSGLQDISGIPTAMIERIEVLRDGASSLYGSDAIGGVINIITRKRFEGLQFNAYVGQYDEGDGTVQKYDFIMGAAGDRGSVTLGGEWTREGRVNAHDREFSRYPLGPRHPDLSWTAVGQVGGWVSTPGELPQITYPINPNTGLPSPVRVVTDDNADTTDFGSYRPQGGTQDRSNTLEYTDLKIPLERKTIFVNGAYELADNLEFLANASYSNRSSDRQIAGYPFQAAAFGTPMSVDSYFNPLGSWHGYEDPKAITSWWRRGWEVPREATRDADSLRFGAALEGDFAFADRNFNWDVNYNYSDSKQLASGFGDFNLARVRQAVGPSFLNDQGQVQCGTPENPIALASCQPWNPFLNAGVEGPGGLTNNPDLWSFLYQEEHATGRTDTQIYNANITGPIVALPAGEMAFALGFERREESGRFIPDALSVTGGSTNLAALPTEGGYDVNEWYGELLVPVLAGVPGAQVLNLNLSSRYSDYTTFGSTTNSKIGVEWRPLNELLVRANWAEGFRAPTIANLFAGGSQTFSFYTDPCDPVFGQATANPAVAARCAADIADYANFRQLRQGFEPVTGPNQQTPVPFFGGAANPLLEPEESESWNVGLVWRPEWEVISGLQMSLDWWQVEITNTIVGDSPNFILQDCYVQGIASRCALFTRDPVDGYVNNMRFGSRNAGFREVEGYDFDVNYRFETQYGDFRVNWQSTYLVKDKLATSDDPGVIPDENIGDAESRVGTVHRIRSLFNVTWSYGDWGVTWGARYYSGLYEGCSFPDECSNPSETGPTPQQARATNHFGSNTFHDLQVRWSAPWDATISVGANNVFEHIGPIMYSQPNSNVVYNGEFDIGRFMYVRYQQNF
jgi:iron complex outermembrane recepter protein